MCEYKSQSVGCNCNQRFFYFIHNSRELTFLLILIEKWCNERLCLFDYRRLVGCFFGRFCRRLIGRGRTISQDHDSAAYDAIFAFEQYGNDILAIDKDIVRAVDHSRHRKESIFVSTRVGDFFTLDAFDVHIRTGYRKCGS